MVLAKLQSKNYLGFFLMVILCLAFLRSYMRIQTTLTGYELGEMKNREMELLEKRSQLQMELAKLTTKDHLTMLADETKSATKVGVLAAH